MDLSIQDICELLEEEESLIRKWIREGSIPAYKMNNQYRFNRSEIREWILKNNKKVSSRMLEISQAREPISILGLLKAGGIHYNVEGQDMPSVLKNALDRMCLPEGLDKKKAVQTLLEREEMMSTGIGKGIAIPHPRNPMITEVRFERIAICFLKSPVDFKAVDNEMIQTLFIVLSAKPERHLEILSKISYLCHQPDIMVLLNGRMAENILLECIQVYENQWLKK